MADCPFDEFADAFLGGVLDGPDADVFESHLGECPACRGRLDTGFGVDPYFLGADFLSPGGDHSEDSLVDRLKAMADPRAAAGGPDFEPPTQFGAYEIGRRLGVGGLGTVYEAFDRRLGRHVALKMLRTDDALADTQVDRLLREGMVLATLSHPNIVRIYEAGWTEGRPFIALELVPGGTLARLTRGRPLAPRDAARAAAALARAVAYAHSRGVIHRDLKPSNVLLQPEGDEGGPAPGPDDDTAPPRLDGLRLLVSDFGLARRSEEASSLTETGQRLGTPSYMAPEQVDPAFGDPGPAADLYGLGAVLYELLTGRPPFSSSDVLVTLRQVVEADPIAPRLLQPGVPPDLETVCLKCLEKAPARRYGGARDLAEDLERFLAGLPITARPVGPVGRSARWARRNTRVATLGAAVAALLVALAAGGMAAAAAQARLRREADAHRRLAEQREQKAVAEKARTDGLVYDAVAMLDGVDIKLNTLPDPGRPEIRLIAEVVRGSRHSLLERYIEGLGTRTELEFSETLCLGSHAFYLVKGQATAARGGAMLDQFAAALAQLPAEKNSDPDQLLGLLAGGREAQGFHLLNRGERAAGVLRLEEAHALIRGRPPYPNSQDAFVGQRLMNALNLAAVYRDDGRAEEAVEVSRDAKDFARKLVEVQPENPSAELYLAQALRSFAESLTVAGRHEEAGRAIEEGFALHRKASERTTAVPFARVVLRELYYCRALHNDATGRPEEARADRVRFEELQ